MVEFLLSFYLLINIVRYTLLLTPLCKDNVNSVSLHIITKRI